MVFHLSPSFMNSATLAAALALSVATALDNGLAAVPAMGWNSWNKFLCHINEDIIRQNVLAMKEKGMLALGYEYINIDDCWSLNERDAEGHTIVDPDAFPSGMKALGDFIHEHGFKFGIYSSAGTMTCEKRAGSLGYEDIDARDFASWGVDYLKYDNCYNNDIPGTIRYAAMRDALNATGRPIYYSLCNWGEEDVWQWAPAIGNSWRTTQDILCRWELVAKNFKHNLEHAERSGPGGWNDPDMMEVGVGNLTVVEEMTHFSLWAISKAPLITGCGITSVRLESLEVLQNNDIIAVNQDPKSRQAACFLGCGESDSPSVYATTVTGGDTVAVIVNWGPIGYGKYTFDTVKIGLVPRPDQLVQVYCMWCHKVIGTYTQEQARTFSVSSIPSHGSWTLRFSLISKPTEFNSAKATFTG